MQAGMEKLIHTFQGIMNEIGIKKNSGMGENQNAESEEWPALNTNAVEHQNATTEPKTSSWSGITQSLQSTFVKGVVKEALKENVQEVKREDERARNIILYKVPESKAVELNKRIHEDMKFIEGLLGQIGVDDVEFDQVLRLGKREKDKVRPLRFRVKDLSQKTTIMENVHRLRDADEKYNSVSVCHDLSPEQRDKLKELVSEAREKSNNDEDFLFKLKDQRGTYWEPRIVRFKRAATVVTQLTDPSKKRRRRKEERGRGRTC
jgi:hypothetical protein